MTDIGDDVTLTTHVRVADQLTEPGTVHLEVVAPDGTTTAPTITNVATGIYQATVLATAPGRWRYTWTTTDPEAVEHDHFDVRQDPPPPGRLDPLASITDLEDRLGRTLTDDEARRAEALLRDASAKIRAYCRQSFDLTRNDVVMLRPVGAELIVPQRPVLAVASVAAIPGDGTDPDITLEGWQWDGLDRIKVGGVSWRTALQYDLEWDWVGWSPETYRVTYDHGYQVTPDDIVAKACELATRVITSPSMVEGMSSERVGPFGYTLAAGAGSAGASVRLTQQDKDDLIAAGYRRTAGTIQLRA